MFLIRFSTCSDVFMSRTPVMESNPTAGDVVLPLDVVFHILVRLPAKEICRFRVVCRHWWSLTCDPVFIVAHTARQPPSPLLVASFRDDNGDHIHVMDLSGHVIKRVPVVNGQTMVRSHSRLDPVCVADPTGSSCSVIDPATGVVSRLPETPPEKHWWWDGSSPAEKGDANGKEEKKNWFRGPMRSDYAIGRVESTGQYKVLRLSSQDWKRDGNDHVKHLTISSVLTLNATPGESQWRSTGRPKFLVDTGKCAVVGTTAYFFWSKDNENLHEYQIDHIRFSDGIVPDCIACFDMETEEWTSTASPPLLRYYDYIDYHDSVVEHESMDLLELSTLAELKGYLVMAHRYNPYDDNHLDLWFLKDIDNCVWDHGYKVLMNQLRKGPDSDMTVAEPLLVLDDGIIVIYWCDEGVLLRYDPRVNAYSRMETGMPLGAKNLEVETGRPDRVRVYASSVLSLFQRVSKVYH